MRFLPGLPVVALALGACGDPCSNGAAWLEGSREIFDTLADASESVPDGETLHVCPGTHSSPDIYFASDEGITYSIVGAGMSRTILDGGHEHYVVYGGSPDSLKVSNLTIRDGMGTRGYPCLDDTCDGPIYGAGFSVFAGTTTLNHVQIEANEADYGAGILVGGTASLTIEGSVVQRNDAGAGGGALLASAGQLVSVNTRWGAGDFDNRDHDIAIASSQHQDANGDTPIATQFDFDGLASFTCDGQTHTCE
jgi:hypothetical protein